MTISRLPDFIRGDTFPIRHTFTEPSTGDAVDITGWQIRLVLQTGLDDDNADIVLDKTVTVGDSTGDDAANGIVNIAVTSTESALLAVGEYHLSLQRIISGSPDDIRTFLTQRIKVKLEV